MYTGFFRPQIVCKGFKLLSVCRISPSHRSVWPKPLVTSETSSFCTSAPRPNMNLSSVIHYLEDGASTDLAESWDNVGLLVEPSPPHTVHKVLVTNDLTLDVCEEAIGTKCDVILSYHPPIFAPLKRLTQKSVKERIVVKCIENRIAVYSPHTVYDNAKDGVNQWIMDAFKDYGLSETAPLHRKYASSPPGGATHQMLLRVNPKADLLVSNIRGILFPDNADDEDLSRTILVSKTTDENGIGKLLVTLRLNECQTTNVTELLDEYPGVLETCSATRLEKLPMPGFGAGLRSRIEKDLTIQSAVNSIKRHMKLDKVRLALGRGKTVDSPVKKVAVCAGSGRSVLQGCEADLYVSGEMSHHDILDCTENGVSVLLTEHSNCERGFLAILKERLERKFEQTEVKFALSEKDHDPVSIV